MICPKCNQEVSDSLKFCTNCGADLQAANRAPNSTLHAPVTDNQHSTPPPVQQPIQQPFPQPPAAPTPKPKRPWYKKWWIWVIIGVVATGAIGAILPDSPETDKGASSSSVSSADAPSSSASAEQNVTEAPNAAATEAPKAAPTEKNTYSVGDSYEANGLTMTVDSCEEYVSDNEFLQPEDGYYYLSVHITITNNSNSDKSVGSGMFSCYVDNQVLSNTYFAGDNMLTSFESLSGGRSAAGYLYYEVPKSAASIELEYTPSYLSSANRVTYKLK